MILREIGYYCLTLRSPPRMEQLPNPYRWVLGYWNGNSWKLPGSRVHFPDEYFEYINEEKICVSEELATEIRGLILDKGPML
jgi:hypothetical protein